MIDTERVLKLADDLEWFTAPGIANLWRIVAKGIRDHESGETVKGWLEGHLHSGGRICSYQQQYFPYGMDLSQVSGWPVEHKRAGTGILHAGPAFDVENIEKRISWQYERMIKVGTRECWLLSDTVPHIGLRDIEVHLRLKEEYPDIRTQVGCYFLHGFKDFKTDRNRLDVGVEALKLGADFIAGLPDRDKSHTVGFKGHVTTILNLAYEYGKWVQFHADEKRTDTQHDTFEIIECIEALPVEKREYFTTPDPKTKRPRVWIVHALSPSCYGPEKFSRLVELLVRYNIGVICCPSASISDRALRTEYAPIHNGIARVIEMLSVGVYVVLGSDNLNDLFMPLGVGLVIWEAARLADDVREYSLRILAKLGMGMKLDEADRASLARSLEQTRLACMMHKKELEKIANSKPLFDF